MITTTLNVSLDSGYNYNDHSFAPVSLGELVEFVQKLKDLGVGDHEMVGTCQLSYSFVGESADLISCGDCIGPNYANDIVVNLHHH